MTLSVFVYQQSSLVHIFFTIGGMDYLVHGGRVGKLSGIAAGALGIKPLILLKEGEIFNNGLTRGRKKSIQKIIEQIIDYFKDNMLDVKKYRFCVGFGYDKEEAVEFREKFIEALKGICPSFNEEILIRQIGATIGVHTGPHPLGVGLLQKD